MTRFALLFSAFFGLMLIFPSHPRMPEVTESVVCKAQVLGVDDGYTCSLAVKGHRPFAGVVCLRGVLAVEITQKPAGPEAQKNLAFNLPVGENVRVQFFYDPNGVEKESSCRPLVVVWREADGVNVNEVQAAWLKERGITTL